MCAVDYTIKMFLHFVFITDENENYEEGSGGLRINVIGTVNYIFIFF